MQYPAGDFILYRLENEDLINRILDLKTEEEPLRLKKKYMQYIGELTQMCEMHGFEGNLWHVLLTYHIAYHENAFSKACEIFPDISLTI